MRCSVKRTSLSSRKTYSHRESNEESRGRLDFLAQSGGRWGVLSHHFARCNPTLQRLGALRVWTLARVGMIAIQPDPAEHKLDSAGSFRVPECCAAGMRLFGDSDYCNVWQKVLCRESHEESPESQWLFGAGLGARSPQRTPRGDMTKPRGLRKNALPPRRRLRNPVGVATKKRSIPK